jgi:hypothetical protein
MLLLFNICSIFGGAHVQYSAYKLTGRLHEEKNIDTSTHVPFTDISA